MRGGKEGRKKTIACSSVGVWANGFHKSLSIVDVQGWQADCKVRPRGYQTCACMRVASVGHLHSTDGAGHSALYHREHPEIFVFNQLQNSILQPRSIVIFLY